MRDRSPYALLEYSHQSIAHYRRRSRLWSSAPPGIARALAADLTAGAGRTGDGRRTPEKSGAAELLLRIRDSGKTTALLIEHDVKLVMGLCDRLTVLDYGKAIAEGRANAGSA